MSSLKANLIGIILGSLTLSITPDFLRVLLASVFAVIMGLLVKLALEWDSNTLTWKRAFIQTTFSLGIGYMTFFWLDGKPFLGIRQEVVLFIMSLAAAHIVSAINTLSQERTRGVLEELLNRLLAKKNETQHKDEAKDKDKLINQ